MMEQSLRSIQKDYENYLHALQMEKKNIKKFLARVDSLAKKNEEIGIEVDANTLKFEKETKLLQVEQDIVKAKKVIHRLGKCIEIMLDGQIKVYTNEGIIDDYDEYEDEE